MFIERGINVNAAWLRTVLIGDSISNWLDRISGVNVQSITTTFIPNPQLYRYPTATMLHLHYVDGKVIDIELQDVSNQASWSTGTQAGINAASSDLNIWFAA